MTPEPAKAPLPLWALDLLGLAACAALGAGCYFMGIAPLDRAREARAALEVTLADRADQRQQLADSKRRQEAHLLSLRQNIEQAAITLEPADNINTRLRALTELAGGHTLRLDEIRPGNPAPLEHYTGVPIRIAGQGRYADVARFLHAVHQEFRDVGITGLDLRGEPEATDKPPTFAVHLLWYAEPAPPPEKTRAPPIRRAEC